MILLVFASGVTAGVSGTVLIIEVLHTRKINKLMDSRQWKPSK